MSRPEPADAAPVGELELHIPLPFGTIPVVGPGCRIDGAPVPARWGVNRIPVWAGLHTVSVDSGALGLGHADQQIRVPPGGQVTLHYAAPVSGLMPGALGPGRQRRPGLKAFWIALAVVAGVVLLTALGLLPVLLTLADP